MIIYSPYFVAAVILEMGVVVDAAPILRYMMGWSAVRVEGYCSRKGWVLYREENENV